MYLGPMGGEEHIYCGCSGGPCEPFASQSVAHATRTLHPAPGGDKGEGEGHTDSRQHAEQPDANAQSQQSCEADAHHTLQDILSHVTDTAYIPSTAYIRERVYTHPIDPTVSTRERSLYYTPNHPPRCCSTSPEHNHT